LRDNRQTIETGRINNNAQGGGDYKVFGDVCCDEKDDPSLPKPHIVSRQRCRRQTWQCFVFITLPNRIALVYVILFTSNFCWVELIFRRVSAAVRCYIHRSLSNFEFIHRAQYIQEFFVEIFWPCRVEKDRWKGSPVFVVCIV